MSEHDPAASKTSYVAHDRRSFLRCASGALAVTAAGNLAVPSVHASGDQAIRLALVGCGGRGTGAVGNALSTTGGPVQLVAMADVFEDRLKTSFASLSRQFGDRVAVDQERKFIGFDAYQRAMECLRPHDVVIFATPPAFRWVHFRAAIDRQLNVFMEKPVTVDGPTTRRMFQLADDATRRNVKVGVGLMWRHCRARQALNERIRNGELGDLVALRAYRQHGPIGSFAASPKPTGISDLLYQIRRFHGFLWASGGCYSDFYIHNIDECCWMKGDWPIQAEANGGRHYRGEYVDQNFDNYTVEYTFPDGTKFWLYGRCMGGCQPNFGSYAHGSKRMAVISIGAKVPSESAIYRHQRRDKADRIWSFGPEEPNPYVMEWEDLLTAIRQDQPYNEVRRGAEASLVTSMGRMAAHTGQIVTYDQILNHDHEFAPDLDQLTMDSPSPLPPDANGLYPVPRPGLVNHREY